VEQLRKNLEQSRDAGNHNFCALVGGVFAGNVFLGLGHGRQSHVGSIGLMVGDEFQGRGLGTALLRHALEFADNWLNLSRIELEVDADNDRAIHIYEKLGFVKEGRMRKLIFRAGAYVDAYFMARVKPGLPLAPALSGEPRSPVEVAQVTLRPPVPDDAADFAEFMSRPETAARLLQVPYRPASEWAERLKGTDPNQHQYVAVVDAKVVGSATLSLWRGRTAHVGELALAVSPDDWGQGIGTRLVGALVDLADNWLNLSRLQLEVYTDNYPAIKLYEKNGFVAEGVKKAAAFRQGGYADLAVMARLREGAR
jgi:putative acetyltransferase